MVTTIQVSHETLRLLKMVKAETGKPYDAIVRDLVLEYKKIPKSMFGAFKGVTWTKADRARSRFEFAKF